MRLGFAQHDTLERQQQIPRADGELRVAAEAVGVQLLEQGEELAAQAVELQTVEMAEIVLLPAHAVKELQVIRRLIPQRGAEFLAEPEDEAAVGRLAADDGAVLRPGRQHEHVPGAQRTRPRADLHVHLALAEEVDLGIGVAVPPDRAEISVAVIEDLEIPREHVLAAVELASELFHVSPPPARFIMLHYTARSVMYATIGAIFFI